MPAVASRTEIRQRLLDEYQALNLLGLDMKWDHYGRRLLSELVENKIEVHGLMESEIPTRLIE